MIEKSAPLKLFIVMPVYNDWDSAKTVLNRIDTTLNTNSLHVRILLINDGSSEAFPKELLDFRPSSITFIHLMNLRRNIGHQRAIAIALAYLFKSHPSDAIVVMDSDGEDRPEDIPLLIDQYIRNDYKRVIFAARKKRVEGYLFKICYRFYQIIHRILTGHSIRVGNFSIIPFSALSPLVVSSELWNHYAASVYKLRIPFSVIQIQRARRISGKSKMNFISLVIHGLSAISVFGETVGTRILFAASVINTLLISILAVVVIIRFCTDLAIPGWATYSTGLLIVLFLQVLATSASFLFFILNNRNMSPFLPLRDYSLYIHKTTQIFPRHE